MAFNKNLLITIVTLSSLLLSTAHASVQSPSPSPSSSPSSAQSFLVANPNNNILGTASSNPGDNLFKSSLLVTNPNNNILGTASSNAGDNLLNPSLHVMNFCKGTENPALCSGTIAPFMEGPFDPMKALETEMEATFIQSKKVAKLIADELRNPNIDRRARGALDICKSQYKSIMETVNEAVELLNEQNVVDAYYKFSSVISDQSTCEDAFVESPGVTIPFAEDSHTVYQLGGNCLAIMDAMVNSRNNFLLA